MCCSEAVPVYGWVCISGLNVSALIQRYGALIGRLFFSLHSELHTYKANSSVVCFKELGRAVYCVVKRTFRNADSLAYSIPVLLHCSSPGVARMIRSAADCRE